MQSNWKEEFDREYIFQDDFYKSQGSRTIKQFIETEIIEKLIKDICEFSDPEREWSDQLEKQQLRAKWLGNGKPSCECATTDRGLQICAYCRERNKEAYEN
jgi:hypothetical protein